MKLSKYALLIALAGLCFSCSDDDDSALKNDFIKKTTAPAIVGEKIEFAYAMGAQEGTLSKAEAVANIAGATGTDFELHSWFTNATKGNIVVDGVSYKPSDDVPLRTVKEAKTEGSVSTAIMEAKIDETYMKPYVPYGTSFVDMIAATVRYAYVVPEEARGKAISFRFSSQSSTGATASCNTPSYKVSKMDMKRLITMKSEDVCYFSIEDMKAYTLAEVTAQNLASKIDFIYLYQEKLNGFDYKHSFISPATDAKFIAISGIVPAGSTNKTLMEKRANVRDAQLKGSVPNVYIDDIDFETLDLSHAMDYALNFNKDDGAFMITADGKYAAYVYVNETVDNVKGIPFTVSIKRYPLK